MANAKFNLSLPSNEPIKSYAPCTPERDEIKSKLQELKNRQIEIPVIIGGKEIKTGNIGKCVLPHDHGTVVGTYHKAGEKEVKMAIETALKARRQWAEMDWQDRASIFLKAADILAGPRRSLLNAASIEVPSDMQGIPLQQTWAAKEIKWRDAIYYHYYEKGFGATPHYGVRTDRYKLIHFYGPSHIKGEEYDEWELYDLEKDPHELNSVYGEPGYSEIQTELNKELVSLREVHRVSD